MSAVRPASTGAGSHDSKNFCWSSVQAGVAYSFSTFDCNVTDSECRIRKSEVGSRKSARAAVILFCVQASIHFGVAQDALNVDARLRERDALDKLSRLIVIRCG